MLPRVYEGLFSRWGTSASSFKVTLATVQPGEFPLIILLNQNLLELLEPLRNCIII
jgi:hypothetical protein